MSLDTVRELVEGHLHNNWTETVVSYQNVPYNPVPGTPFIKCSVLPAIGRQADIGSSNNLFQFDGIITIGIFTPRGQGSKRGNDLASDLQSLFLKYDNGGLRCKVGYVNVVGEDESWWHISVVIPWTYEQIL